MYHLLSSVSSQSTSWDIGSHHRRNIYVVRISFHPSSCHKENVCLLRYVQLFNSFLRRRCFSLSTFPSCYATVISRRFSYGHASNDGTRRTNDKGRKIQKSLRVMKTSGTMQEQEHEQLSMGGNTGEGEVEEKVYCLLP